MNVKKNALFIIALFSLFTVPAFAEMKADVKEVQHLTELLKDGQEGYKMASSGVRNLALKSLFTDYELQRAKFLQDLRNEVLRLGGNPDEGASALGAVHRGWINIRTAVSQKDDKAIVDEVLRGEKAALDEYQEALGKTLPDETRGLVEKQRQAIQAAYDSVKSVDIRQEQQS